MAIRKHNECVRRCANLCRRVNAISPCVEMGARKSSTNWKFIYKNTTGERNDDDKCIEESTKSIKWNILMWSLHASHTLPVTEDGWRHTHTHKHETKFKTKTSESLVYFPSNTGQNCQWNVIGSTAEEWVDRMTRTRHKHWARIYPNTKSACSDIQMNLCTE